MSRKSLNIPLLLLALTAMAIRLLFCAWRTGLGYTTDHYYLEYSLTGKRLLIEQAFLCPFVLDDMLAGPSSLLPPIYVFIVYGVYSFLGVESYASTLTLQIINTLSIAIAVVIIFHVTSRFVNSRAAWVASILITFNPALFGFTHLIWETYLFALMISITLWWSVQLRNTIPNTKQCLFFGFWLGVVALLNPALTISYPLFVLWPLTRHYGWKLQPLLKNIVIVMIGWVIVITPWTIRNYDQFDKFIYIRNGFMHELWLGVCPEAETDGSKIYTQQFPYYQDHLQQRVSAIGENAYIQERGEWAIRAIIENPLRYLKLVGVRTVDYWLGTIYSHMPQGAGGWPKNFPRTIVTIFLTGEITLLMFCLVYLKKINSNIKWLIGILILYSLIYCITHMHLRFRAPMEPIMAVVLGILVSDVWQRITSHPSSQ